MKSRGIAGGFTKILVSAREIFKTRQIDKWFLTQIQELVGLETELKRYSLNNIPKDVFFNFMIDHKVDTYYL